MPGFQCPSRAATSPRSGGIRAHQPRSPGHLIRILPPVDKACPDPSVRNETKERAHLAYKAAIDANRRRGSPDDDGVSAGCSSIRSLWPRTSCCSPPAWSPWGKDQGQHVEMARDVADAFNTRYGEILTVPEPLVDPAVATIPGLDGRKMIKSSQPSRLSSLRGWDQSSNRTLPAVSGSGESDGVSARYRASGGALAGLQPVTSVLPRSRRRDRHGWQSIGSAEQDRVPAALGLGHP